MEDSGGKMEVAYGKVSTKEKVPQTIVVCSFVGSFGYAERCSRFGRGKYGDIRERRSIGKSCG